MSRANTRRVAQAEVQQRRQSRRRMLLLSIGSTLAIAVTVSTLLLLNQTFRVTAWEVTAEGHDADRLKQQIELSMEQLPLNDFWSARPGVIREQLLAAVADLEEVTVQRTLSGTLFLKAKARTPIGLWQNGENQIFLVDMHGYAYRPLAASENMDLPLLRIGQSDIRQACQLLNTMQSIRPGYFARISELLAESDSWKINFDQGQQWMISRNEHMSHAISRVSGLLQKPRWRSGHWRVDARTSSRWFVRPARQEGVI